MSARGRPDRGGGPTSAGELSGQSTVSKRSPTTWPTSNRVFGLMAIWVSELPKAEPEEGGILGREFEADVAIDHRNRFRGHGEGGEGYEIG